MNKRYQIFISSTFEDLKDERAKVMETILNNDCFPAGMEMFPAMDEEQFEYIKRIIDDSDYYLLIIGGRYGSVDENGVSWTEKEYDYAIQRGIHVLVFDHEDYTSLPANKTERSVKKQRKLEAFKKKASKNKLIKKWSNADNLALKVSNSLKRVLEIHPGIGWVRANSIVGITSDEEEKRLQQKIVALETQVVEKERSIQLLQRDIKQAQDEQKRLKAQVEEKEKKQLAVAKGYHELQAEKELVQKELNTLKAQIIEDDNKLHEFEQTYKLAQERILFLETEMKRFKTSTKLQQCSELSNKVSQAEQSSIKELHFKKIKFNMIHIEGGTFMMGALDHDNEAMERERPAHLVTLSDYWIGETQVTQALWRAVMMFNPSEFTGDKNLPVEKISWNDCQEFIRRLNEADELKEQLHNMGLKFCLPSEAQWEFAARGGNKGKKNSFKYAGSDIIDQVAWYGENSISRTHPVATGKIPNELGLFDMSGNVWEWCQDKFGNYTRDSQFNPKGAKDGSLRVIRGGGWANGKKFCRVSYRSNGEPDHFWSSNGLRLALVPIKE